MNPEVRFRVSPHVYELAEQRSDELGLSGSKGRSGGVSELARAGLYLLLNLPLPADAHWLQSQRFDDVRLARRALTGDDARIGLRLLHRVDPEVRRQAALERGQAIASLATTRFEFEPGEVPPELSSWFQLTESGLPVGEIDLSGGPLAVGALVSASPEATLSELLQAVGELNEKRASEQERRRHREIQRENGQRELSDWVSEHGSAHARALLEEGFDWLDRAEREYGVWRLQAFGVGGVMALKGSQSLAAAHESPRLVAVSEPGLESIERLRSIRARLSGQSGLKASLVCRQDDLEELVLIEVAVPTGNTVQFLSPDQPATPFRKQARPAAGRPRMQSLRGD
ncbi:hypothetical protein DYH09_20085 [bacterium CPR1]|nr:hypothetical protein [bacterium CPR1]